MVGMARPKAIRWFDWLYFAHLAPVLAYQGPSFAAIFREFPGPFVWSIGSTEGVTWAALGFIWKLVLWAFISRWASRVAKWILVVWTGVSAVAVPIFVSLPETSALISTFGLWAFSISLVLSIAATIMLFRPDARAWFAARGKPADPED